MYWLLFFFFKQKTAYEMRISDWSSDVCSSDLRIHAVFDASLASVHDGRLGQMTDEQRVSVGLAIVAQREQEMFFGILKAQIVDWRMEIGRASCRERVCQYV